MKPWRNKLVLLAGTALIAAGAFPAFSQDAPESLLPPGFEDSNTLPPREEAPRPDAPAPQAQTPPGMTVLTDETELEAPEENLPPPVEMPDFARRSTDVVGTLGPDGWGMGNGAFGNANGALLSTLMRRMDAPLPSRWTSIMLRRALMSRVPAPPHVHPVDWVAERAWLLLRMGEADAARMLVQAVDVDQFTPRMFSVAVQTALATADPAALCPLVEPGRRYSDEAVWTLSDAICAALAGEASRASALIDQARRRGTARGADLLLAEKIVGAGTDTRRAVTIEWEDVDRLNTWRFGLAAAAGVEIPQPLIDAAGPQMRAWQARAPMIPVDQRVDAAQTAASLGVFSNASLVEMQSLIADSLDVTEVQGSVGARLRDAYTANGMNARVEAIRSLWQEAESPSDRYARHILTAVAAARLAPSADLGADAPRLIASMLSAGMDRAAIRWSGAVEDMEGGAARDLAWALLAVASPDPEVEIGSGQIESFRSNDDSEGKHRSDLLVAALAGLGRIAPDGGAEFAQENAWTRALDAAVRARQPGTVALLAGVGMQTPDWRGVPPGHLYRIVRALRLVGMDYYARMIAAEALGRP